jgi:hypothetical protein
VLDVMHFSWLGMDGRTFAANCDLRVALGVAQ